MNTRKPTTFLLLLALVCFTGISAKLWRTAPPEYQRSEPLPVPQEMPPEYKKAFGKYVLRNIEQNDSSIILSLEYSGKNE